MEVINEQPKIPVFFNNPIVVLILGIVTCGLYLIYWNIKMAEVANALTGRETISTVIAALAGLCWPINLYFYLIMGRAVMPTLYNRLGTASNGDQTILYAILGFFFPMVAAMLVQNEINKLYE